MSRSEAERHSAHARRVLTHLEQAAAGAAANDLDAPPFETTPAERALLVIVNQFRAELAAVCAERDAAHVELDRLNFALQACTETNRDLVIAMRAADPGSLPDEAE
jgi:hypothetical protein